MDVWSECHETSKMIFSLYSMLLSQNFKVCLTHFYPLKVSPKDIKCFIRDVWQGSKQASEYIQTSRVLKPIISYFGVRKFPP